MSVIAQIESCVRILEALRFHCACTAEWECDAMAEWDGMRWEGMGVRWNGSAMG